DLARGYAVRTELFGVATRAISRTPMTRTTRGTNQITGFASPTAKYVSAQAAHASPEAGSKLQINRPARPDRRAAHMCAGNSSGTTSQPTCDNSRTTVIAARATFNPTLRATFTGHGFTWPRSRLRPRGCAQASRSLPRWAELNQPRS